MCAKGIASTLQGCQQPSHLSTESEAQTTAQIWGCSGTARQFLPFFQGFKFNFYDYLIFSLSLLILLGFVCLFPFPDFESFST